jgi:DNA gyrase subunit A
MQLRRLVNLEQRKILDEYAEVVKTIAYLEDLLANPKRMLLLINEEVNELKSKYGDPRRTEISEQGAVEFREEDLIPHQRVVVTLSDRGFVKRVPSRAYTPQHRGGKGIIGMVTREKDAVRLLTVADTHDNLLFFTNRGKVFRLKCHEIPSDVSRIAKGMAVINLFPVAEAEKVTAMVAITELKPEVYLLLATRRGEIKKTAGNHFASVRSSGLIAIDLEEGDELVAACLATDQDDVILVTQKGQSIRFTVSKLRSSSRTSGGVRGIRMASGDRVIGMEVVDPDACLLVISSNGFGKRTALGAYPSQKRGGSGVRTFKVIPKTGKLVASRLVYPSQELMLVSARGIIIRTSIDEIPVQGRGTQGVYVMRVEPGDSVASIGPIAKE